ncbi:Esterase SGNH hydrolase-type subgroup [Penicillium canariense]|uniref:Esterase SGNH hydrolase-type subgroup n=1 Tax=Penicillium canariense TaxID=189055 RepID=A0A9W9HJQ8_9EURO|nr:Esterase SGNH hydrolase-type subgroup [Penicillium canariense]KAJ5151143.1 Esterase SGNH hydrolase-type subgroup [Penicillium canariense]
MRVAQRGLALLVWSLQVAATILQNGQVREHPYPGQAPKIVLDGSWNIYGADSPEIAYKGRWDSKHVSWWSFVSPIPNTPFFSARPPLVAVLTSPVHPESNWNLLEARILTHSQLAVSFGPSTTDGVLVAYRLGSLDWQFSNVTAAATYQFIGDWTGLSTEEVHEKKTFEMRVQIDGVATAGDAELTVPPRFKKKVEIIGGSLATGQYGTYETISGWAFLFAAGLGNVEHSITAYPGACLTDNKCYGGVHGMTWYWHRASDPGSRAHAFYGNEPEKWDVEAEQPADLVLIQMGGNDHRHPNEVPGKDFYNAYVDMIEDIHRVWPHAVVLIVSQWGSFVKSGMTYEPTQIYEQEARAVHEHFKERGFVYYFDTTGILQYNDINPKNHPTDVGHIKLASHLLQWTRLVLRWNLEPLGEVQHGTLYWNDQQDY